MPINKLKKITSKVITCACVAFEKKKKKSTIKVVPETHSCTNCEGTSGFGMLNTCVSPDVLRSCSSWLSSLVSACVCVCCYFLQKSLLLLSYIYISKGELVIVKQSYNLKAQKVYSLQSLK